jgi:hypothetical protein
MLHHGFFGGQMYEYVDMPTTKRGITDSKSQKMRKAFRRSRIGTLAVTKVREHRAAKTSPFFQLPAEIRNRIYFFLVQNPRPVKIRPSPMRRMGMPRNCPMDVAILLVCRQFHVELASIFYGDTYFYAWSAEIVLDWLKQIGPKNFQSLRHLEFRGCYVSPLKDIVTAIDLLHYLQKKETPLKSLTVDLNTVDMAHRKHLHGQDGEDVKRKYDAFYKQLGMFFHAAVLEIKFVDPHAISEIEKAMTRWKRRDHYVVHNWYVYYKHYVKTNLNASLC